MQQITMPVMIKSKFSENTGISKSQLDVFIESGKLPSIKLSPRVTVINLAKLNQQCLEDLKQDAELKEAIQNHKSN